MNKFDPSIINKNITIILLIILTSCTTVKNTYSQMGNSFNRLIVFKKHVTAQSKRLPQGNEKYIKYSKILNEKSNIDNSDHNLEVNYKGVIEKQEDQPIKDTSNRESNKSSFFKNLFNGKRVNDSSNHSKIDYKEVDDLNIQGSVKEDTEQYHNKNLLKPLSRDRRKLQDMNENISNDQIYPDLRTVPSKPITNIEQDIQKFDSKVEDMQREIEQNKREVKDIKNQVNFVETDSSKSSLDKEKINNINDNIREVDSNGFYMNSTSSKRYNKHSKLIPASRYDSN